MDRAVIYYGPQKGFEEELAKQGVKDDNMVTLTSLVHKSDEAKRQFKHVVTVQGEENETPETEISAIENLVGRSDEYASIREHAILNFDGFIAEFKIDNLFLQNPPQLLETKIIKIFPKVEKIYFEYQHIDEKQIININDIFGKTIFGQEQAKKSILKSLIPLTRPDHHTPVVLLFYGPSGVGKTETAKFLSQILGGKLLRKQLSMFQNADFLKYLFGGEHHEKSFAKELLDRETNVILLDEFDKAPTTFHSAFYQLFDEGIFEDKNYTVNIANAVIVCTTNYESLEQARKNLGDPIFSRFDVCIKYEELSESTIMDIVRLRIKTEWRNTPKADRSLVDKEEIEKQFQRVATRIENARRVKGLVREVFSQRVLERILTSPICRSTDLEE